MPGEELCKPAARSPTPRFMELGGPTTRLPSSKLPTFDQSATFPLNQNATSLHKEH